MALKQFENCKSKTKSDGIILVTLFSCTKFMSQVKQASVTEINAQE